MPRLITMVWLTVNDSKGAVSSTRPRISSCRLILLVMARLLLQNVLPMHER